MLILLACALLAAVIAGAGCWVVATARAASAAAEAAAQASAAADRAERSERDLAAVRLQADAAKVEVARLEAQLDSARTTETRLSDTFAAVSREALDRNTRSFLDLAQSRLAQQQAEAAGALDQRRAAVEQLVAPLRDSLARMEQQMAGIESARQEAYAGLNTQVKGLTETHERLRTETASLVGALKSPQTRGRWGEVQLRRVVELAGMVPHCDFEEQVTLTRAGTIRRPDLVVRLPGTRLLAVDAKVPLSSYLAAHEEQDPDRRALLLREHARAMRSHINSLADKAYWEQFPQAPDFVVLFIPGEPFLAAAFEHDPELFEYAHAKRVLVTSPTTLIALLQSVAVGWRQESMAEDARAVCDLGAELYKRLTTMGGHVANVGKALNRAVEAYNQQVGSMESRVFVTARRLATTEVGEQLPALEPLELTARMPQPPDIAALPPADDTDPEVA